MTASIRPAPQPPSPDDTAADAAERDALAQAQQERAQTMDALVRARHEGIELSMRIARVTEDHERFAARSQRELESARRYANDEIVQALLPAVDGLDHSIRAAPDDHPLRAALVGVRDALEAVLARHGVTSFQTVGEVFDPARAEAVALRSVDGVPPNVVVEEWRRGWLLHDRLLRAALVAVSGA